MPELPDAPGLFETGMGTPRNGSVSLPSVRTIWSEPPPTPQVQMKSIGREGYLSWAEAVTAPVARTTARTHPMQTERLFMAASSHV